MSSPRARNFHIEFSLGSRKGWERHCSCSLSALPCSRHCCAKGEPWKSGITLENGLCVPRKGELMPEKLSPSQPRQESLRERMFFTSARPKSHLGVICGAAPARALAGCQGQAQGRILLGWEVWHHLSYQGLITHSVCVGCGWEGVRREGTALPARHH